MNRFLSSTLVLALVALLSPSTAAADEGFPLQISAGLKGGVNGVAGYGFDNPSRYTVDNTTYEFNPEYYGHFGLGPAGGLALEIRAFDIVGLEFGFHYASQTARGYVDKNQASTGQRITRVTSEQETTAYNIPILLKFTAPTNFVRPAFGIGVELVRQSEASISYDEEPAAGQAGQAFLNDLNANNQVRPVNYTLLQFTLGAEILAGPVRIPIELRAGYALGYDQDIEARAEFNPAGSPRLLVDTIYMGHFGIFTGVIYEFDLRL